MSVSIGSLSFQHGKGWGEDAPARETLERKGDDPRVHCRQWEPHDEMEQRRERTGIGEQPCGEDARVPPR